jgi:hypothetical protein
MGYFLLAFQMKSQSENAKRLAVSAHGRKKKSLVGRSVVWELEAGKFY